MVLSTVRGKNNAIARHPVGLVSVLSGPAPLPRKVGHIRENVVIVLDGTDLEFLVPINQQVEVGVVKERAIILRKKKKKLCASVCASAREKVRERVWAPLEKG